MDRLCDDFIKQIIKKVVQECTTAPLEKVSLSKMKKGDLVKECITLGLEATGSVLELKGRIKDHTKLSGAKPSRSKKIKKIAPVHTHELCTQIVPGCPLCQAHGNIMCLKESTYEIV